jgi:hypothetical protein
VSKSTNKNVINSHLPWLKYFLLITMKNICVVKIAALATQNCSSKELALQCREWRTNIGRILPPSLQDIASWQNIAVRYILPSGRSAVPLLFVWSWRKTESERSQWNRIKCVSFSCFLKYQNADFLHDGRNWCFVEVLYDTNQFFLLSNWEKVF